jgi:hypothetical protein
MTTATLANCRPQRKQLSDQLDRLDSILDALSEGLSGAVTDAVRDGVHLAVKHAVIELMTDPTLRSRLHEATAPEPAQPIKKPGLWARLKAKAGQAMTAVRRTASHLVDGAVRSVQLVVEAAAESVRALQALGSMKKLALVGVAAGIAMAATSFLAPHAVSVAVSGLSGAVAAAAVQVGVWTRRAYRAFTIA